jgi:hypothetical protein
MNPASAGRLPSQSGQPAQEPQDQLQKLDAKVKWRANNLSLNGRDTVAKSILFSQYTYIVSFLDNTPDNEYYKIQNILDHFVLYNSFYKPSV